MLRPKGLSVFGKKVVPALVVLVGLGGCADTNQSKQVGQTIAALPEISAPVTTAGETIWSARPTSGMQQFQWPISPSVEQGQVVVVGYDGTIASLEPTTGDTLTTLSAEHHWIAGPTVDQDKVLVADRKGHVVAMSLSTKQTLWQAKLSTVGMAAPTVDHDQVFVHTNDSHVFALDKHTGEQQWEYEHPTSPLQMHGVSQPLVVEDKVLIGTSTGKLVALDRTSGRLLWDEVIAVPAGFSELQRLVDVAHQPIVKGRQLFVATYQGKVASLHLATGQVLWQRDASTLQPLALSGDRLLIAESSGVISAIDIKSGSVIWRQTALKNRHPLGPSVIGELVTVLDGEGYLYHLALDDGKLLNLERVTGKISQTPVSAGNYLYIQADNGPILARRY